MASATPPGDPRQAAPASGGNGGGAMPVVGKPAGGLSWIVIGAVLAVFAVGLFLLLDARRRALNAPAVRAGAADRAALPGSAAPPPLYVPPAPAAPAPQPQAGLVLPPPPAPAPQPQIIYLPQPPAQQLPGPEPAAPQRTTADPALVYDFSAADPAPAPGGDSAPTAGTAPSAPGASPVAGSRARAGVLANRTTTVPQGTLIPAVLETGLDSTRPGLARAMVTRDVHGFDGKRILIPRGSRLIGEYASQAQPGQKRALVNWIRLIRPDGVTIAIGSPASDPVGRGGIRARVDSHFFERFAGAILQSALDIGVNVASRQANSPVIVALPGAIQSGAQGITQQQEITPTLSVKPGASITIFVARDLDFTGADNRR